MKSFNLQCDQGHTFELMVKSAASLAEQQARGLVTCPYCDSPAVERTLATPTVLGGKGRDKQEAPVTVSRQPILNDDMAKAYKFFSDMRKHVEANHENVGTQFAEEARAMHYGEKEERGIYGEATGEEVTALLDEGVGIAPLPNLPKANA